MNGDAENIYKQLKAEGFSEDDIETIMGLYGLGEELKNLPSDVRFAQQRIRDVEAPEGREAGEAYVAAHPLEFLSAALTTGVEEARRAKARQEQNQVAKEIERARLMALGRGRAARPTPGRLPQTITPEDVILNQGRSAGMSGGMALISPYDQAALAARGR